MAKEKGIKYSFKTGYYDDIKTSRNIFTTTSSNRDIAGFEFTKLTIRAAYDGGPISMLTLENTITREKKKIVPVEGWDFVKNFLKKEYGEIRVEGSIYVDPATLKHNKPEVVKEDISEYDLNELMYKKELEIKDEYYRIKWERDPAEKKKLINAMGEEKTMVKENTNVSLKKGTSESWFNVLLYRKKLAIIENYNACVKLAKSVKEKEELTKARDFKISKVENELNEKYDIEYTIPIFSEELFEEVFEQFTEEINSVVGSNADNIKLENNFKSSNNAIITINGLDIVHEKDIEEIKEFIFEYGYLIDECEAFYTKTKSCYNNIVEEYVDTDHSKINYRIVVTAINNPYSK